MWMLDTEMCSYVLRKRPPKVKAKFEAVGSTGLAISHIVAAELYYGAARHPTRAEEIREAVDDFLGRLRVLPWNASVQYGALRAHLEAAGKPMGNMDLLIAAHALASDAVLVTNNIRHYKNVPRLRVENWLN